ncbi:metalloregulator ArsR/SmtB family transcription factor [Vibrio agarivorans]|uniref:metalloregulator ArsR/SmtB family transcription factor n=1 Tax=Vibrio agarivorans TaxID=153622 RepID=UPI00222F275C|nr:metalloregulator ArsR/SmtB family transcription factor [Vibrio agarivorans]MDN3659768.1 metalloregulator ArsR/SmtB family transcription factor [Vibrio agarivorans]
MKKRILFVCTGNSARSQLAEAIVNHDYGDDYIAYSAGSVSKKIDPRTFSTLEAHGYPTDNMHSKALDAFDGKEFDYLITLCTSAHSECAAIPGVKETLSWDVPQPKIKAIDNSFSPTFEELKKRIHLFTLVHNDEPEDELDITSLYKCISDKARLMIVAMLYIEKELSVGELCESLQEPQPKISRALSQLSKCGLLQSRRQGLWIYYSISSTLPSWAIAILEQTVIAKHQQLHATLKLLNAMDRPRIDHTRTN